MTYPFPYVGSGIAAARKQMECWLCFVHDIPVAARAAIEDGVPEPLAGYFNWSGRVVVFGHGDDSLQWVVRGVYDHIVDEDHEDDDEMPSAGMWKAFNEELDRWLLRVHGQHPVALFIKPIDEEYSTETDAWHDWSCERIPDGALPIVEALGKKHRAVAGYVAAMWQSWVRDQPFERQQALIAALGEAGRARLDAHDVLFVPERDEPERGSPTIDEGEQLWRRCATELEPSPRGLRLEDAYNLAAVAAGKHHESSLTNHFQALIDAERYDDAVALARAALASGVEFPTHWYPSLVDSLVALGRLDDAAREMPHLVGTLESYHSEMLISAMNFHRAKGEPAVEAMLYHAGRKWFTSFNYHHTKKEAARFGKPPRDLAQQFADWFIGWCQQGYFDLATQPRLGHFLVWFDEIGKQACGAWVGRFEAERDRRAQLREAIATVTDEASASALVDQLLPSADAEDAARAAHELRGVAPLAAYRLLVGAIANEHRCHYRYPRGGRVDAVISTTYLALNVPALADKLDEAYAIGRGYVLSSNAGVHFNLACCAARLGRRADALVHIGRALALDWADPQQIHDDNDLEPLRGDPAFEQLFVADAARRAAAKAATDAEAARIAAKKAARAAKKAKAPKKREPKPPKAPKPRTKPTTKKPYL